MLYNMGTYKNKLRNVKLYLTYFKFIIEEVELLVWEHVRRFT